MGVRRCAWCGRWLGLARVGWGQVTHGICRRCLRREYASMPTLAQPEAEDTGDHSEVGCFYLAAEILGAIAGGLYGTKLAAWIGWRLHWIPAAWIGALLAAAVAATWIYRRKR